MEQMGARLKVVFETALDVINFLLIPVRALGSLLWMLRGDTDDATAATDKLNEAMIETGKAQATAAAAMGARTRDIKALYTQALNDLGYQQIAAQEAALQSADAYSAGFSELLGEAATKAGKILSDGKIYVQDYRDAVEEVVLSLEDSPEAMLNAYGALAAAGMTEEIQQLEVLRQAREQSLAKAGGAGQDTSAPRGTSSAVRTAADEVVYAVELAEGGYERITKAQYDALDTMQQQTGDYSQRIMEMSREDFANMERYADSVYLNDIELNEKRLEAQADYQKKLQAGTNAFQAAFNAARQEMLDKEEEAEKTKAANILKAKQVVFNLAITQNAKMLAAAIVAEKKGSEIARAALGNVASGLGDIAMVKSATYAAEGLFPQAAGMAVAGTLGYTIAAVLGADKKANAGPPTERQQPVQNYAYNLRIDSTFADSESISRRFAQMQEGARQRGLITGMA
jgi:hypothetical protein